MSEYQYYEFQAIDRPLTAKEMDELRSYSTRARITPTSFVNDYSWGDFKGDQGSTSMFQKDKILTSLVDADQTQVTELLQRFIKEHSEGDGKPVTTGRTVGELRVGRSRRSRGQ
jgi:hypothetical protein